MCAEAMQLIFLHRDQCSAIPQTSFTLDLLVCIVNVNEAAVARCGQILITQKKNYHVCVRWRKLKNNFIDD